MSETAAPKPPSMQRIPLAAESANGDAPSGSLERLINFYIEKAPDQARSDLILKSAPSLVASYAVGSGPIWALNDDLSGRLYIASGTRLWAVWGTDITHPIDMGAIGAPSGADPIPPITIAVGPTQVVVCVPPNAYAAGVGDTSVRQIAGSFPGASSVAYIDGYFVFTATENSSQFFCAPLFDPTAFGTTITTLNFAFSDAVPNVVRRVMWHRGNLWFMGENAIEIWGDTGDSDFPFRRVPGGFILHPVFSPKGCAICDGSMFWLGRDGIVFRSNGLNAVRVSTHAVEYRIRQTGLVPNAVSCAFSFVEDGHEMFALTMNNAVGGAMLTLVYDCATQRWHDRSSSADGSGRWVPQCSTVSANGLFGSSVGGTLYVQSDAIEPPPNLAVPRIAILPPLWGGTRLACMYRLEVECELGGTSSMTLDWTDDAGATWKGGRVLPVTGKRAYTTRLGSFRERTFRLTTTGKSRIFGVDAHIASGDV